VRLYAVQFNQSGPFQVGKSDQFVVSWRDNTLSSKAIGGIAGGIAGGVLLIALSAFSLRRYIRRLQKAAGLGGQARPGSIKPELDGQTGAKEESELGRQTQSESEGQECQP
jgi:hypothetical protein